MCANIRFFLLTADKMQVFYIPNTDKMQVLPFSNTDKVQVFLWNGMKKASQNARLWCLFVLMRLVDDVETSVLL